MFYPRRRETPQKGTHFTPQVEESPPTVDVLRTKFTV